MHIISILQWIVLLIIIGLVAGAIFLFARALNNRRPKGHRLEGRSAVAPVDGPSGFQGWLVLLAIGVVLSPIVTILKLVNSGDFGDLSSGGETYLVPIIDIALSAVVILLQLCTAFLLILRKRQFCAFYIATVIAMILLWPAQLLNMTTQVSVLVPEPFSRALHSVLNDQGTADEAARWIPTAIVSAIWLLYVIRSRRVANTFVR